MYLINEVATIASISTRTLRYYDSIQLLTPSNRNNSDYRVYSEEDIDRLQLILIYKKLGLDLDSIKRILVEGVDNDVPLLENHLMLLEKQKASMDVLIQTIKQTILNKKGVVTMNNKDKFKGLIDEVIQRNEEKFAGEIRSKYSEKVVEESYKKLRGMSETDYLKAKQLEQDILTGLRDSLSNKDEGSDRLIDVCRMHQDWLKMHWPFYDKSAHLSLVEGYLEDERFKAYYENRAGEGATELLVQAMRRFLKE